MAREIGGARCDVPPEEYQLSEPKWPQCLVCIYICMPAMCTHDLAQATELVLIFSPNRPDDVISSVLCVAKQLV